MLEVIAVLALVQRAESSLASPTLAHSTMRAGWAALPNWAVQAAPDWAAAAVALG